jgi:hypothetical protein
MRSLSVKRVRRAFAIRFDMSLDTFPKTTIAGRTAWVNRVVVKR